MNEEARTKILSSRVRHRRSNGPAGCVLQKFPRLQQWRWKWQPVLITWVTMDIIISCKSSRSPRRYESCNFKRSNMVEIQSNHRQPFPWCQTILFPFAVVSLKTNQVTTSCMAITPQARSKSIDLCNTNLPSIPPRKSWRYRAGFSRRSPPKNRSWTLGLQQSAHVSNYKLNEPPQNQPDAQQIPNESILNPLVSNQRSHVTKRSFIYFKIVHLKGLLYHRYKETCRQWSEWKRALFGHFAKWLQDKTRHKSGRALKQMMANISIIPLRWRWARIEWSLTHVQGDSRLRGIKHPFVHGRPRKAAALYKNKRKNRNSVSIAYLI